ncbi:hypothetical protein NYO98_09100 [Nocardioides sp. STR2]|uniref:Uncharacterized protein n=1 Tax=Nocardioides pini TaxID=2975053 RepID=A0ABT4CBW0_9ACTN|nr:hypothetical protein [Nocardioides pini]MCY4726435.1 hypothetical protein [Nocardioides pini]
MHPYEADALTRAIIADRIRETEHQRLAREVKQYKRRNDVSTATAPADRHSRLWRLVHLSHAYG